MRSYSLNIANNEKTDNWFEAVLKGLTLGIQLDTFTDVFQKIIQAFKPSFDFNVWFKSLSKIGKNAFSDLSLRITTLFNQAHSRLKKTLNFEALFQIFINKTYSEIGKFIFETFTSLGGSFFSLWENFANAFNGYMDGTYTSFQGIAVFLLNASIMAISIYVPNANVAVVSFGSVISNLILNFEILFGNGHFWG